MIGRLTTVLATYDWGCQYSAGMRRPIGDPDLFMQYNTRL
jgi:hypothetical protein